MFPLHVSKHVGAAELVLHLPAVFTRKDGQLQMAETIKYKREKVQCNNEEEIIKKQNWKWVESIKKMINARDDKMNAYWKEGSVRLIY